MSFKVAARTLLHLGAELISSDTLALQELIKNAFDAGSRRVTVDVMVRVPYAIVREVDERLDEEWRHRDDDNISTSDMLSDLRQIVQPNVDRTAPGAQAL